MNQKIEIKNSEVRILLLDNLTLEIKYLKDVLEQYSYCVAIAPDGPQALEQIKADKPHIIICDVEMAGMDGYEFCSHVKSVEEFRDIPVILLSQVSGPTDIIKGLESGADNFILKPYNNRQLLTRLHDILMSRELRKKQLESDKLDVFFLGKNYSITLNKVQVLDLLFSVLENTIRKNEELEYVMDRLMVAMDNIRNLDQLKNDFISSVSHEIRTPLTSISGALRLIQGGVCGVIPTKATDLLEIANRNLNRLLLLLNDILDIQRIESGRMMFNINHHKLLPLIEQAVETNAALAEKYGVSIKLQDRAQDCLVNVDPDRLIQILTNLLSNATKFSPQGGVVTIRVLLSSQTVKIAVADRGPGIPDKFRTTIYDRFTQTTSPTHKQKEGTGLGLHIAKILTERLNGTIDFKSKLGKGTTFYIELPRIKE